MNANMATVVQPITSGIEVTARAVDVEIKKRKRSKGRASSEPPEERRRVEKIRDTSYSWIPDMKPPKPRKRVSQAESLRKNLEGGEYWKNALKECSTEGRRLRNRVVVPCEEESSVKKRKYSATKKNLQISSSNLDAAPVIDIPTTAFELNQASQLNDAVTKNFEVVRVENNLTGSDTRKSDDDKSSNVVVEVEKKPTLWKRRLWNPKEMESRQKYNYYGECDGRFGQKFIAIKLDNNQIKIFPNNKEQIISVDHTNYIRECDVPLHYDPLLPRLLDNENDFTYEVLGNGLRIPCAKGRKNTIKTNEIQAHHSNPEHSHSFLNDTVPAVGSEEHDLDVVVTATTSSTAYSTATCQPEVPEAKIEENHDATVQVKTIGNEIKIIEEDVQHDGKVESGGKENAILPIPENQETLVSEDMINLCVSKRDVAAVRAYIRLLQLERNN